MAEKKVPAPDLVDSPDADELYTENDPAETPKAVITNQPPALPVTPSDTPAEGMMQKHGEKENSAKDDNDDSAEKKMAMSLSSFFTDSEEDEILVPYQTRTKSPPPFEAKPQPNSSHSTETKNPCPRDKELYADVDKEKIQEAPAIVMANQQFSRNTDTMSTGSTVFSDSEEEEELRMKDKEQKNQTSEPPLPAYAVSNETQQSNPDKQESTNQGKENPGFESEAAESEAGSSQTGDSRSTTKISISLDGLQDDAPMNTDFDCGIYVPEKAPIGSDEEDEEEKKVTFEEIYMKKKASEIKSYSLNSSRRKDWLAFGDYDDSDSDAAEILTKIPGGNTKSVPEEQHALDLGCMCCPCSTWCVERKLNKGSHYNQNRGRGGGKKEMPWSKGVWRRN